MFCLACLSDKCLKIPLFISCWSELYLFVGNLYWRSQLLTVFIWFSSLFSHIFFFLCLVLFDSLLKQFICIFFSLPCYSSHLHFVCPVPLFHHFVIIHLCHRFFPLPITLHLPASPYPPVFHYPGQHWLIFLFFTFHFLFFNSNILTFLSSFAPHFLNLFCPLPPSFVYQLTSLVYPPNTSYPPYLYTHT